MWSSKEKMAEVCEISSEAKLIIDNLAKGIPPKKTVNILVVGMPGVGKSSLINSCIMALNANGYENVAPHGDFGLYGAVTQTRITLKVHRYPIEDHIEIGDFGVLQCKPVFWDCPGLMDENDENMRTLLEYLLSGRIPEGKDPVRMRKWSVTKLKWKYKRQINEANRINIVCFVHAAGDPVPKHLLTAVSSATMNNKREIPVMLVVSKMDKMVDFRLADPEVKTRFETRDLPALQSTLGIRGVKEVLFLLTLYCEDATPIPTAIKDRITLSFPRSTQIDRDICKLWQTMLKPVYVMRDDINWPVTFGKK